jgi:hypothetical protein
MTDTQTATNNRLGCLWDKEGGRGAYMTGQIDPSRWDDETLAWVIATLTARERVPLVVFKRDKSSDPDGSRRPDWDLVRPREKFTLTKASDITPEAGGPDDVFGKAKASGAITGSDDEWLKIRREANAARIRTVTDSDVPF